MNEIQLREANNEEIKQIQDIIQKVLHWLDDNEVSPQICLSALSRIVVQIIYESGFEKKDMLVNLGLTFDRYEEDRKNATINPK